MTFSAEKADKAVNFFERVLVHTKGEWAGRPFVLTEWQKNDIIRPLFGTLNDDGSRQYRTAYIELPRKNGKSEIAAGIALYLLLADDEMGAEVYGAAGDRDQASIVFNVAAQMMRMSEPLRGMMDSGQVKLIDSMKRIIDMRRGGFYRAIPADAATSHGFNANGVIFDELHVQPNRDLWDVLTTSTGARRQPLIFTITTAGFDRLSICYEQHDYAEKILKGIIEDPTFFAYIRAAPENGDWTDEALWFDCNPALGDFRSLEEMRALANKAKQTPALENTFRRLYLNQWTRSETRWIGLDKWDACNAKLRRGLRGKPCYGGLDLASTTDIAAFVLVFPDNKGAYDVLPFFWIPVEGMYQRTRRDRVPYEVWVKQGLIQATPGATIDYGSIRYMIRKLSEQYDIQDIGYDRWGMEQLRTELVDDGIKVVQIGQGYASMSAPTKELEKLVLSKKLRHGGNPVLRWMADNVMVTQDAAGNLKPDRAKSTEKIDGIVALIMAIDRATRSENAPSKYEEEELLVL